MAGIEKKRCRTRSTGATQPLPQRNRCSTAAEKHWFTLPDSCQRATYRKRVACNISQSSRKNAIAPGLFVPGAIATRFSRQSRAVAVCDWLWFVAVAYRRPGGPLRPGPRSSGPRRSTGGAPGGPSSNLWSLTSNAFSRASMSASRSPSGLPGLGALASGALGPLSAGGPGGGAFTSGLGPLMSGFGGGGGFGGFGSFGAFGSPLIGWPLACGGASIGGRLVPLPIWGVGPFCGGPKGGSFCLIICCGAANHWGILWGEGT